MGGSRILFLGTGGDEFVIGKQLRASGGIIFSYESNQFCIDPGPGSMLMSKMTNVNIRETDAIFVTGNKLFRANDVNAIISGMTHDGLDKRGVLICPSSVVMDENNNEHPFVNRKYKKYLEKTIVIDNTTRIGINDVEVEVIKLKEHISENCGYKFVTPRFNLAYIPDTSYSPELAKQLTNTDVLILSVKEPHDSEKKSSLNTRLAQEIIKAVRPQLVILTGFGIKMMQSDPLYEAREIQKSTGVQIIAAKDGMSINPISFAATVRQKNLKSF